MVVMYLRADLVGHPLAAEEDVLAAGAVYALEEVVDIDGRDGAVVLLHPLAESVVGVGRRIGTVVDGRGEVRVVVAYGERAVGGHVPHRVVGVGRARRAAGPVGGGMGAVGVGIGFLIKYGVPQNYQNTH